MEEVGGGYMGGNSRTKSNCRGLMSRFRPPSSLPLRWEKGGEEMDGSGRNCSQRALFPPHEEIPLFPSTPSTQGRKGQKARITPPRHRTRSLSGHGWLDGDGDVQDFFPRHVWGRRRVRRRKWPNFPNPHASPSLRPRPRFPIDL